MEQDVSEGVLLVEASIVFNFQVVLHNIMRLSPPLASILINTYSDPSKLFLDGEVVFSQEGTTQEDPLAMPTYGTCNHSPHAEDRRKHHTSMVR